MSVTVAEGRLAMSQMLLCMGVAASFATLCATLSYGYLVLGRVVQADEARRPSLHQPSLASDTPPDAFAQLSTSSRFRPVRGAARGRSTPGRPDRVLQEPERRATGDGWRR